MFPAGSLTTSWLYWLAGTVAIRTLAPLARHLFYVFIRIDEVDVLALNGGDGKNHQRSKTNPVGYVKYQS